MKKVLILMCLFLLAVGGIVIYNGLFRHRTKDVVEKSIVSVEENVALKKIKKRNREVSSLEAKKTVYVSEKESRKKQAGTEIEKTKTSFNANGAEILEKSESGYKHSSYKYVIEKPTGWFKTGQEADIVLYGTSFGESGGRLVMDNPGKTATDGKRLIVSDTWNNRVLIWNVIPTKNNTSPDLVLGQDNFNTNYSGLAADRLNWPMGVSTDGKKLVVADTYNNRILIWNTFPSRNGQPADIVLGADDFTVRSSEFGRRDKNTFINNPWDVWTDGTKLVSSGGPVFIWNTFPTHNNQRADIILGFDDFANRFSEARGDFPSPRGIASDGDRLAIGTYEPRGIFIYAKFPEKNGQDPDFFLPLKDWGAMGLSLKNNKLFAVSHSRFFIWNSFPKFSKKADIIYRPRRTNEQIMLAPGKRKLFLDQIAYGYGIAASDDKLIIADSNNKRVLIWNQIPKKAGENADVILGKPEIFYSRNSFGSGPAPYSDGERLFVGVDGFGVWIYNHLPDENKAEADVVLGLNIMPPEFGVIGGRVASDGKKLFMVYRGDKSMIFVWNEIPSKDNQAPDYSIGGKVGMSGSMDVDTDGKSLFVSDTGNKRVLVWNEIPSEDKMPDFVLGQYDFNSSEEGNTGNRFSSPVGLSSDGKRLAVSDLENQRVMIWNLPIKKNGQAADLIIKVWTKDAPAEVPEVSLHFNLPQDVEIYNDKLFVADGGANRVLIWNTFPKDDTPPDIILGQKNLMSSLPSNHKDGLFAPVSISFDGNFLWVGETKYSGRLLRFSI